MNIEKNIVEIRSIAELMQHVHNPSHVFFDLDNTVFMPVHDFGSAAWEAFMIEYLVRDGVSQEEAIDRASDLWKAVQTVSSIKFVEEQTPEIIQRLRHQGYPVLAITSRSPELEAMTESQLVSLNLSFQQIFYCGKVDKGEVLQTYVKMHRCPRIVMVDDTLYHLKTASEYLHIPFIGLRYGYMDDHRKNYAPCPATLLLSKIVNHPQACKFLKKGLTK